MKGFAWFLVALSLAFVVFSITYGVRYGRLRGVDRYEERERYEIHSTVKAVSIPYYLLCLGFFVGVLRTSPLQKSPIAGILVSVVMTAWSFILGSAVSFDEVFLAWVGAAVLLAILKLVALGSLAGRQIKAS